MFDKGIQGNLEGKSSSLSEVTKGFLAGNPSIVIFTQCNPISQRTAINGGPVVGL